MAAAAKLPFSDQWRFLKAARDGELDRVKLFVAQGADLACKDCDGRNAIILASNATQLHVVKYLLSLEGDHPATIDKSGKTAL